MFSAAAAMDWLIQFLPCLTILVNPARSRTHFRSPRKPASIYQSRLVQWARPEYGPDQGRYIQVVAGSAERVAPGRPPTNLIETLRTLGMRSYMRNDPAKERERERESGDRGA